MKLRNRKTDEIIEYDEEVIYYRKLTPNGHEDWTPYHPEDWEDYTPAEPLIKDQKIRQAVRAWAEANEIETVEYNEYWVSFRRDDKTIGFKDEDRCLGFFGLENSKDYTIAELCGEKRQ